VAVGRKLRFEISISLLYNNIAYAGKLTSNSGIWHNIYKVFISIHNYPKLIPSKQFNSKFIETEPVIATPAADAADINYVVSPKILL
jgi:hypothetical protein